MVETKTRPQNANLVAPWKPGQSGNPAGHPKNEPLITPRLRRFLQMSLAEIAEVQALDKTGELCVADALALRMLEKAMGVWGDRMTEVIIDRVDGLQKSGDISITGAQVLVQILRETPELGI